MPAIEYFGNQTTFSETNKKIDLYARSFKELQKDPESSVTFCTPTLPSTKFFFYALNKLGIRANFVSDTILPSDGTRYLDETKTEILVVFDQFYPKLAEAIARTSVKNILIVSLSDCIETIPEHFPDKLKYALSANGAEAIKNKAIPGKEYFSLEDYTKISNGKNYPVDSVCSSDKTAVILYTGGSTGIPKGVEKTNAEFVAMGNIYDDPELGLNVKAGERNGIFIPPNHPTSLVNSMVAQWFFGTTNVLQPIYNRFTFPYDIFNLKLNIAVAAPSHYFTFPNTDLPDGALKGFRLPMCGGEAVNERLYDKVNSALKRLGAQNPLTVAYGMSEIGPLAIMTVGRRAGKPVPGADMRLIGIDGNEIIGPGRGKGEIRNPGLHMKGYYKEPELTKEFWTVDGYAITLDIFDRDKGGYYDAKGRAEDYFTDASGEIHYMFDIENFLSVNESVLEVEIQKLVIDRGSIEIPVAHLVLDNNAGKNEAEIIRELSEMCEKGLQKEKRPLGYRIHHEFGTNPISTKRDYQALALIRDGYYNNDSNGLFEISFPENSPPEKRYIGADGIDIS